MKLNEKMDKLNSNQIVVNRLSGIHVEKGEKVNMQHNS